MRGRHISSLFSFSLTSESTKFSPIDGFKGVIVDSNDSIAGSDKNLVQLRMPSGSNYMGFFNFYLTDFFKCVPVEKYQTTCSIIFAH